MIVIDNEDFQDFCYGRWTKEDPQKEGLYATYNLSSGEISFVLVFEDMYGKFCWEDINLDYWWSEPLSFPDLPPPEKKESNTTNNVSKNLFDILQKDNTRQIEKFEKSLKGKNV